MAKRLTSFTLGDGESVWVEVDEAVSAGGVVKASADGGLAAVQQSMDASLEKLRRLCELVFEKLRDTAPSEISVEMGVKLDAKAGIVLASTETGCHLTVHLAWKR